MKDFHCSSISESPDIIMPKSSKGAAEEPGILAGSAVNADKSGFCIWKPSYKGRFVPFISGVCAIICESGVFRVGEVVDCVRGP